MYPQKNFVIKIFPIISHYLKSGLRTKLKMSKSILFEFNEHMFHILPFKQFFFKIKLTYRIRKYYLIDLHTAYLYNFTSQR